MFFFRRQRELPAYVQEYLAAARPDSRLPWRAVPYSVLDVETSGLDYRRDALLAIGMVPIEEGRVRLDRHWYTLLRPPDGLLVGADSIRIHGLLRDELAQAPPATEVLPELLRQLSGRVLVVHVAAIDIRFINRALQQHYGIKLQGPALDTARLAHTIHFTEQLISGREAREPAVALRLLAAQANLPIYAEHNALNDAITTAQLFLAQATRLEQQGANLLRGLLRAGRA